MSEWPCLILVNNVPSPVMAGPSPPGFQLAASWSAQKAPNKIAWPEFDSIGQDARVYGRREACHYTR